MRTQNFKLPIVPLLLSLFLGSSFSASANHGINKSFGTMLSGFDVVAYHTMGKAVKGSKEISTEWLGGKWLFVSEEHRELFLNDPASYIPQFGDYCSAAYIDGKAHGGIDPYAWQIVEGKLYLFFGSSAAIGWNVGSKPVQSANKKWEKAKSGLLQQ